MNDTPESINTLADDWFLNEGFDNAEAVEKALRNYATLLEQVAAHERECAGKWVRCEDRLPERLWEGQVITESGVLLQGFSFRDDDFGFLRGSQFIKALSRVALWLDARKPGGGAMKHLTIILCALLAGCGHTAEPYPDGAWPAGISSVREMPMTLPKVVRYSTLHIQCPNGNTFEGALITDQPLDTDMLCASVAPIGTCALLQYRNGNIWGSCEESARTELLNRLNGLNSWCLTSSDGVACYEGDAPND